MRKKYPGRRTFKEWSELPYKERHAWVVQEQCDLLGYWKDCPKKKRCRRARTCRGDQFACFYDRRDRRSPAERARDDAKCAWLVKILNVGPEFRE